jgi:hypothetical protein
LLAVLPLALSEARRASLASSNRVVTRSTISVSALSSSISAAASANAPNSIDRE